MPEMDGVAFLKKLRSDDAWRDLPVILVTAVSEGPVLDHAYTLGIRASLVKGCFSGDELLARLREACGISPLPEADAGD